MNEKKPLIIYHANCPDGFCAAWIASEALKSDRLHKGKYGEAPPIELAEGCDVYVVDFSYPRAQLEQLAAVAKSLTVLDHHKTAEADLRGFPGCTFDMNRSGAGITWDHFHPGKRRPWIVDYVEDRDLWRFKLPDSRKISTYIRAIPHTLEAWTYESSRKLEWISPEALGAQKYLEHYVDNALIASRRVLIDEWKGVVVNCTYTGISDVLHAALERNEGAEVALGWYIGSDGSINASLASRSDIDCSPFAQAFGGGGHAQACGFKVKDGVLKFIEDIFKTNTIYTDAFWRGLCDSQQDGFENVWGASVAREHFNDRAKWAAPDYIEAKDRNRYLAGYGCYIDIAWQRGDARFDWVNPEEKS